jgi:hypothetical protein
MLVERTAAAEVAHQTFSLDWHAPDGCPDASEVTHRVRSYLGPFKSTDRTVSATARVVHDNGVWRAEIRTSVGDVTLDRRLEAGRCDALADATALLIALSVNPAALANPPPPVSQEVTQPKPESEPARTVVSTDGIDAAPGPPAPRGEPLRGIASLSARAETGALPEVAYGAFAAAGILKGWFRLEGTGAVTLPETAQVTNRAGISARFRKASGGIRACGTPSPGARIEIAACAGGELVTVHAESAGIAEPSSGNTLWGEVTLGAQARLLASGPFGIDVDIGAGVPVGRANFAMDPYGIVHKVAPVTSRFGMGFDVRF